jgi:RNA polymerase sigma-B factor
MSAPTGPSQFAITSRPTVPPPGLATPGMAGTAITGVATVPRQDGPTSNGPVRRTGYEHLAPLFAEHAALPEGHPHRARLRAELIAGYLPVARNIAHRYGYRGEHPEDLEQVASVGLILAVDRFDPGRGIDFLSFAVPTITGEVLRFFRDRATTIRLPRRLRTLQGQIHDAAADLAQRHGRAARPSEIARHLNVDIETVLEALAAQGAGYTVSLDEPTWDDDGGSRSVDRTRLAAAIGQVEPEFDLVENRESLAPLLAELPERERRILLLRFFGGQTQTEIAVQVGLSQMHVSRLLSRTLTRLRRQLTTE